MVARSPSSFSGVAEVNHGGRAYALSPEGALAQYAAMLYVEDRHGAARAREEGERGEEKKRWLHVGGE